MCFEIWSRHSFCACIDLYIKISAISGGVYERRIGGGGGGAHPVVAQSRGVWGHAPPGHFCYLYALK